MAAIAPSASLPSLLLSTLCPCLSPASSSCCYYSVPIQSLPAPPSMPNSTTTSMSLWRAESRIAFCNLVHSAIPFETLSCPRAGNTGLTRYTMKRSFFYFECSTSQLGHRGQCIQPPGTFICSFERRKAIQLQFSALYFLITSVFSSTQ